MASDPIYYQSETNLDVVGAGAGGEGDHEGLIIGSKPCINKRCLIRTCFIVLTLGLGAVIYGGIQLNNWKNTLNRDVCDDTYVAVPLQVGPIYSNNAQSILWSIALPTGTWNCTTYQVPPLPKVVVGQEHILYVNDNNNRCSVWEEDPVDCSDCGNNPSQYINTAFGYGSAAAVWCLAWVLLSVFMVLEHQCWCRIY